MASSMRLLWMLLSLIIAVHQIHAQWTEPFFENPDDMTIGHIVVDFDGNAATVTLDEEIDPEVTIIKLTYTGTNEPSIVENSGNDGNLGLLARQRPDTKWELYITKKQNYETMSTPYTYNLKVDSQICILTFINRNINDNAPSFEVIGGQNCDVPENHPVGSEINCEYWLRDIDGFTIDDVKFSVVSPNQGQFELVVMEPAEANTIKTKLKLLTELDYETRNLHTLTLQAEDTAHGGTQSGSTTVFVSVQDFQDTLPRWIVSPQSVWEVQEESEHTMSILAQDGDTGNPREISYELTGDPIFTLEDPGDGSRIIKMQAVDRDDTPNPGQLLSYTVTIKALETEEPSQSIETTMTVLVTDLNDNPPKVEPSTITELTASINEEEAVTIAFDGVDTITFKDPDMGTAGQFLITLEDVDTENPWASAFLVIPSTGYQDQVVTISVRDASKIDYEALPAEKTIQLTLKAVEILDNTHAVSIPITITVINKVDEAPQFTQDVYEAPVPENAKKDDPVVKVEATDGDIGDVFTYRIITTTKAFVIDPATGDIKIAIDNALDYEQQSEITLQVEARDSNSLLDFAEVKITINDINDVKPTLTGSFTDISVEENKDNDFEITREITATDPDTTALLLFSIDWDRSYATRRGVRVTDTTLYLDVVSVETDYANPEMTGDAFAIIKVAAKEKLDYEQFDTLYLMMVVTDENSNVPEAASSSGLQAINLVNIEDNAPEFNQNTVDAAKIVVENTSSGQLIGYVVATDPDQLASITYSIAPIGTSVAEWVAIDPTQGELRTGTVAIDSEQLLAEEMKYMVTADDGTQQTSVEITIIVLDENDVYPVIEAIPTIDITEHEPTGTFVYQLVATDGDYSAPYKRIQYELDPRGQSYPTVSQLLSVNSETGEILVEYTGDLQLDREEVVDGKLTVYINVKDNPVQEPGYFTNQLITQTSFVINLLDINDNSPELQDANIAPFPETAGGDYLVHTGIFATDADTGENAVVTYKILLIDSVTRPDPPDNLFVLDPVNDKVNIKTGIDPLGYYGDYEVTIEAADTGTAGQGSNPTQKIYTIQIIDVNDSPPEFVFPIEDNIRLLFEQTVGEDLIVDGGSTLELIEASDADDGENGRVGFELIGDDTALEYFQLERSIEPNKARLTLVKPFVEGMWAFNLIIEAKDNGSPEPQEATKTTKIYIIDNNDLKPIFNETMSPLEWEESDPNLKATIIQAYDPNNPPRPPEEYEDIFYHLMGTDGVGSTDNFQLDSITRELSLKEALDHEQYKSHRLVIVASNSITPPSPILIEDQQRLIVEVDVIGIPDSDPYFNKTLYVGGISPAESSGYEVMRVQAIEPDGLDVDSLTYNIKPGSISASEDYLEAVMDTAFEIQNSDSVAIIKTNFAPTSDMEGYFTFTLQATDTTNKVAETLVQIYIISPSNRVYFLFVNDNDYVNQKRDYIAQVFETHLGYDCSVDGVTAINDVQSNKAENRTQVRTHFINVDSNLPVPGSEIEASATNYETLIAMQTDLRKEALELVDVLTQFEEEDNLAQILTIALIVVSVVLGLLVIILFLAFVVKTRRLNQRLKALTTTKFGSQESGLNRLGMQVPNTNKHAVEGSNPVWNEDVPTYDSQSNGSGDSDLIGVEDRPEFGYEKETVSRNSNEGGYYSGSEIAAAAAAAMAHEQHIASTEL